MPLATRAATLGIPPRLHTTKPKAKKIYKKKSRKVKKWSADDSDESSDHVVKKKGKSKWRRVETSGDDTESVEENVEAAEVETVKVVDLVDVEQEVSINHLYTCSKLTVMVTHNSRIPPKT